MSSDNTPKNTPEKPGLSEPWQKGKSGNPKGRPKGSKNKLSEDFVHALMADFERYGLYPIARTRRKDPAGYLRVIASILPKEIKAHVNHEHLHTHEAVSETADWIEGVLGSSEKEPTEKSRAH